VSYRPFRAQSFTATCSYSKAQMARSPVRLFPGLLEKQPVKADHSSLGNFGNN